ncbi:beta-defensin 122-like [Ochotona princeps]|uniref:beta-defensin 122-like n=1 Tax=Ochotona princeps TaxID=9978 RepID=UPI002715529F|nr:beta-defensin 122-like [Ochotona princeps]
MKISLVTLTVFLMLFQMFSVCRSRKSCWIIKGHCRQDCKAGERMKKPCRNGDYCCIPNKTDSQPYKPPQTPIRKAHSFHDRRTKLNFPVVFNNDDNFGN